MEAQLESIRLLIVDDESFLRRTLEAYFQSAEDITVLGSCDSGYGALEVLDKNVVDVVLSDVRMPRLGGIGLAQKIWEEKIPCRLVALTAFDDEHAMLEMLNFGAFGFVLKSAKPGEIIDAVRSAAHGGTTISPESATALRKYLASFPAADVEKLPARERQVLALLHTGKNNAAIANELEIAETTVKKTVARLLQRYNVGSRLELVVATGKFGRLTANRTQDGMW